jgi:hypothetical protein
VGRQPQSLEGEKMTYHPYQVLFTDGPLEGQVHEMPALKIAEDGLNPRNCDGVRVPAEECGYFYQYRVKRGKGYYQKTVRIW